MNRTTKIFNGTVADNLGRTIRFDNEKALRQFLYEFKVGDQISITIKKQRISRTYKQNAALHLWFELTAKELNEAGYTVQMVVNEKQDMDWTGELVKELLWRPEQKRILNKESTTALEKINDIDQVYEHLNRHLGEKFKLHVPFPQDEEYQRFNLSR